MHKIDVVVKYFYPVVAGIEINVLNVYGHMVPHDWDVTIHTSNGTETAPASLPATGEIRGLKIRRYPWRWWGYYPKIDWQHSDLLALHNFDIFPHSWILILAGARRLFGLRTPKIFLTPHGGFTITTGWHTYPLWQRIIKKTYQNTLGVFLINNIVDGYRAVSAWECGETAKNGVSRNKIRVITNGLEDESYEDIDKLASAGIKKTVKDLGSYVIQVGRIHPIKNQATTIKALTLVPDVNFAVVGPVTDPRYQKELDELIKKLRLKDRVRFLGSISGIDKYYLLKHSLAYSHMSTWESYCNTVHEAKSQGCICVVSKDTALEELIQDGETGFAVPVFDYESVARKLNLIIADPNSKLIQKIRRQCLAFTQGHSWREISLQVENFYKVNL